MELEPTPVDRSATNRIAAAIIIAAIVVAAAIVLVARGPNPCDEWNDRAKVLIRQTDNLSPGALTPEQASNLQSELRETVASQPEDCEFREDVQEELNNFTQDT